MTIQRFFITTLLLLPAMPALAQEEREYPVYEVYRISQPPEVDGEFSEDFWGDLPVATGFVLNETHEPAPYATEVRLAWDEEALYAGFTCYDPDIDGLNARDSILKIWWGDNVELFVDPQATRSRYFQILAGANGLSDGSYNGDFAADIQHTVATGRTDEAWTVELRFPFSAMGAAPSLGERWGINFTRVRSERDPEGAERMQSLWSPTDAGHGSPGHFGYAVFAGVIGSDPPRAQPVLAVTDRLLDRIRAESRGEWRWTDADVNFGMRNERAERLVALNGMLAVYPETQILYYVRPAISDTHILPWTVPAAEEVRNNITLTACRGEYESASLAIFAVHDLTSVSLRLSPLTSAEGHTLPVSAADPFHVIPWYQSGSGTIFQSRRTLLAELLMKDPGLVTVDPAARENVLAFQGLPDDADSLQPVDIPAFESRQFWITYSIPKDQPAGTYTGTVAITAGGNTVEKAPVSIRVPEWDLVASPMWHGLYYSRRLPKLETVAEEEAWFATFEAEIRHQIEHGCNTVATYMHFTSLPSDPSPTASAERLYRIQQEYGISNTPYVCIVEQIGFQTGEALDKLTETSKQRSAWAKERVYTNYYFHGMDEASGDKLAAERESFQAAREGGSGVFVACRPSFFDIIGDLLNLPCVTGRLHPDLADRVHDTGGRILSYGNPQAGVELPNVYRRNYGLALRAAGYDGAMNYEYGTLDPEGAWDDFDGDGNYRDHNFAYVAKDRPVSTIQFAGWREAVDDIRYAATLEARIEEVLATPNQSDLAWASKDWLAKLTGFEDLEAVRKEMVRRMEELGD